MNLRGLDRMHGLEIIVVIDRAIDPRHGGQRGQADHRVEVLAAFGAIQLSPSVFVRESPTRTDRGPKPRNIPFLALGRIRTGSGTFARQPQGAQPEQKLDQTHCVHGTNANSNLMSDGGIRTIYELGESRNTDAPG